MIKAIVQKELALHFRDGRVLALLVILIGLGVAAAVSGWSKVQVMERDRLAAAAIDREIWDNQGEKNPHTAAHFSRYAFRPTSNLAVFDPGITDYVGKVVWLEAHYRDPAALRAVEDAVEIQRFAALSPAWILQSFAPVLAVLLVFASVAAERENGTLRHVMSAGVGARTVFWGKGAAALLMLALLAPVVVIAVAMTSLAGDSAHLPGAPLRLSAMIAAYIAYIAAFTFAAIGVSARSRRTKTALLVLIGFWAMSAVVAPRLSSDVGELAHPSPNGPEFWAELEEESSSAFWGGSDEAVALRNTVRDDLLAEYDVETIEELPINYDGYLLQASEEFANDVFDRKYDELWTTFERQAETARLFSLISPTIAVRNISSTLAGTDLFAHQHFTDAAELFRRDFVRILNEDMINNGGVDGYGYQTNETFWVQNPDFEYAPPGFAEVAARTWPDAAILLAWCVFGFSLAFGGVRRSFVQEARA